MVLVNNEKADSIFENVKIELKWKSTRIEDSMQPPLSSFCILSNSSISVLLAGRTAFLLLCATAPQSGQRSGSFSAEKQ